MYFFRDLDHRTFPYVHSTAASREAGKDIEYPVGTGMYMGAVAQAVHAPDSYFRLTAVGLAIAGMLGVWLTGLIAADRRRALLFALSPSVFLYAFHNWDLIAVALTALGLWAFVRRKDVVAGLALGVGGSTKLYPLFLLLPLAVARWQECEDPRPSAKLRSLVPLGAGAAVAFAVMNVPILLANPRGWWYPWKFQSDRFTNFETHWYMLYRHLAKAASTKFWFSTYPKIMNLANAAAFLVGSVLLVRAEVRRVARDPVLRFRIANVSFGILLIWLLTAKVFSPQYMLWVLPFFVLIELPLVSFIAFTIVDAAVWAAISAYFLAFQYHAGSPELRLDLLEVTVYARYAVLIWLLWLSRRAEERVLWSADASATMDA